MFVGCLHHLNYRSVGLNILTNCGKVPGLCPATGSFFYSLPNREFICQKTLYAPKSL